VTQIRRVLCPIDLSDYSRHALHHAAAFARWYAARIVVVHTFTAPQPLVAVSKSPGDVPLLPPIQPEDVIEDVRRFCEPLTAAGVTPEIVVREGSPAREIVDVAQAMDADFLIMGTHGRSGFARRLLGSVTEKVLRTVRCPVLTVPQPGQHSAPTPVLFKTILCPLDFSESSTRALAYALSLVKESDARLILLHVLESVVDPHALGAAAHFSVPEYHRLLAHDALHRLQTALPEDARVWCEPEAQLVTGKAYREILRVARESSTDLIVMGVHGRGAVDLMLFGSTAHHVVRSATCPVLTLRS
jgi:nucleotide-binding universal stress UspA family protein